MAIAVVNSQIIPFTTGGTSLNFTPANGNLVVLSSWGRTGVDVPSHSATDGWTLRGTVDIDDATTRRQMGVFTTTGDGSAFSDNINVQWDGGTISRLDIVVEYSGISEADFQEFIGADNGTTQNATSLSIGPTSSWTDPQVIGLLGCKMNSTNPSGSVAFTTNGMTESESSVGGANEMHGLVTHEDVTGTGTVSRTLGLTASNTNNYGYVGGFLVFSSGGGATDYIAPGVLGSVGVATFVPSLVATAEISLPEPLSDVNGTPRASVSGINATLFSGDDADSLGTALQTFTNLSTDASGNLENLVVTASITAGQYYRLVLDGNSKAWTAHYRVQA